MTGGAPNPPFFFHTGLRHMAWKDFGGSHNIESDHLLRARVPRTHCKSADCPESGDPTNFHKTVLKFGCSESHMTGPAPVSAGVAVEKDEG